MGIWMGRTNAILMKNGRRWKTIGCATLGGGAEEFGRTSNMSSRSLEYDSGAVMIAHAYCASADDCWRYILMRAALRAPPAPLTDGCDRITGVEGEVHVGNKKR